MVGESQTSSCRSLLLPAAEAYALLADVVAEHRSKDKILLGRQLVQRTDDNFPYYLHALLPSEKQIHFFRRNSLNFIADAVAFQPSCGKFAVTAAHCEQYHRTDALFVFIDAVHKQLQFRRQQKLRRLRLSRRHSQRARLSTALW